MCSMLMHINSSLECSEDNMSINAQKTSILFKHTLNQVEKIHQQPHMIHPTCVRNLHDSSNYQRLKIIWRDQGRLTVLPHGWTTRSTFMIPLIIKDEFTCNIISVNRIFVGLPHGNRGRGIFLHGDGGESPLQGRAWIFAQYLQKFHLYYISLR